IMLRALELLLTATHGRQGTPARLVTGKSRGKRQLATTAIFLALGLDWLGGNDLRLGRATTHGGNATRLFVFVIDNRGRSHNRRLRGGSAATSLFLGTTTGLGLRSETSLFLSLAASRFLALLLASRLFLGATGC